MAGPDFGLRLLACQILQFDAIELDVDLTEEMKDLYIRFLIWLGAAPPEGYEHLVSSEQARKSLHASPADFGFLLIRMLIPFDGFVIQTNLNSEEIIQKLCQVVEPFKFGSGSLQHLCTAVAAKEGSIDKQNKYYSMFKINTKKNGSN